MAQQNSLWTVPSLQRYRPVLFALTAVAVGCTIYYVNESLSPARQTTLSRNGVRRSNAGRRPRRRRTVPDREATQEGPQDQENQPGLESEVDWVTQVEEDIEVRTIDSDSSRGIEATEDEESKDGQSLLTLLYKIAEERTRKDGYVHRGVQCNSCNEHPIRGIRYRCLNCADYDLCEQCEALPIHPKTHLFYKIRIPAPFIGAHKERQPVLYPGKPQAISQDLRKDKLDQFSRETGFRTEEIEAIWEQFRCMAATDWTNDPDHYHLAIDRPTFDKCFIPTASSHQPPPNLIYDRLFSYYDTNNDGLIGLEEFIKGLASHKKKNADDRLRRVFNGYDMDGDGYIDRRDVLRIFKAYYALTRELTADIVAGMQDDADDGDARDLIAGGQPISSAFTGSIPRRDDRRSGTGKNVNRFGDDVVVDGLGAVDIENSGIDVDLDTLIADNAERARFPDGSGKGSGEEIYDFAFNKPWSTVVSYFENLNIEIPIEPDAETEREQRYELQKSLAREYLDRRITRRNALIQRAQRQYFISEGETPSNIDDFPLEAGGLLVDPRLYTRMGKDLAEIRTSQDRFKQLKTRLEAHIKDMQWPVHSTTFFRETLLRLITNGWNEEALLQDLDGFTPDHQQVRQFVDTLSKLLGEMAGNAREDPEFKEEIKRVGTVGRSRSSSKVRFEDGVGDEEDDTRSATSISSRSRPINERWGGIAISDPDLDVGREIIYQVTQEALVELLDPMFKLREDMALHALVDQKDRKMFRRQIIAATASDDDLRKTQQYLEYYQRRWREGDPSLPLNYELHDDETILFHQFVQDMDHGKENNLTGVDCPYCYKSGKRIFVRVGEFCPGGPHPERGHKAWGRRENDMNSFPAELCSNCLQLGNSNSITSLYCPHCGEKHPWLKAQFVKMREIISAGLNEQSQSTENREEQPVEETPEGQTAPQDESQKPLESSGQQTSPPGQTPTVSSPTDEETKTLESQESSAPEYPEMATELHSSVSAFNEFDAPALEARIGSKPLDELLSDSGYAALSRHQSGETPSHSINDTPSYSYTQTTDQRTDMPPPDPTLPQNRPNTIHHETHPPPSSSSPPAKAPISHPATDNSTPPPPPTSSTKPKPTSSSSSPNSQQRPSPGESACRFYAAMDLLEAEDRERGGPGRLNFEEFEEVMKGSKAASLGFIGGWIEVAGF